jgi:hypothetical protein
LPQKIKQGSIIYIFHTHRDAQMYATNIFHPFFSKKPSMASLAIVARSGESNRTCAILTFAPVSFGVGDCTT